MQHHTLFISDLHLDPSTPAQNKTFVHFLKTSALQADALYILGDFFDVWIGDDHRTPFIDEIKSALYDFTQRDIPTYFMRGNRDFLLGKQFAKATGMQLLSDPTTIQLYGENILLMHGDSLCTLDTKHQKFRRFVNKPFNQAWMLATPLRFRQWVAKRMRQQSQHHQSTLNDTIMDVAESAVVDVLEHNKTKLLIHGHTHRPAIHTWQLHHDTYKRIVLGAWHRCGSVLHYADDGNFQLIELPLVSKLNDANH